MFDAPLEWFGRYVLLEPLGQGGMGRVDLALATPISPGELEQLVVLKRLRADLDSSPEAVAALREEAALAARLVHPNVIRTLGTEETPTELAMVMEYVEGHALVELMVAHHARGTRLPVPVALRIVSDVLLGLEWAHSARDDRGRPLNLVHRDVTPHNVLLTYGRQVKLLDFGIARIANAANRTATGLVKGKLGYMSPEQVLSERLDRRTDVFAAGVILWELLAGKRLVRDARATWEYVSHAAPLPSVREVASVDAPLASIVDRALAHSPEDRFGSAAELRIALDAYAVASDLHASRHDMARHLTSILGGEQRARSARILARYAFVHEALRNQPVAATSAAPAPLSLSSDAPVASESRLSVLPRASRLAAWPLALAAGLCAVGVGGATGSPRVAAHASSAASRLHNQKRFIERRVESLRTSGGTNRTDARERPSPDRDTTRPRGDHGG